jgi:ribosome-associated protein YbcJ (S4-like RNA binding protein)
MSVSEKEIFTAEDTEGRRGKKIIERANFRLEN